jgi:hypothetical protein
LHAYKIQPRREIKETDPPKIVIYSNIEWNKICKKFQRRILVIYAVSFQVLIVVIIKTREGKRPYEVPESAYDIPKWACGMDFCMKSWWDVHHLQKSQERLRSHTMKTQKVKKKLWFFLAG